MSFSKGFKPKMYLPAKPTIPMMEYAEEIAAVLNEDLPKVISFESIGKFIGDHKEEYREELEYRRMNNPYPVKHGYL